MGLWVRGALLIALFLGISGCNQQKRLDDAATLVGEGRHADAVRLLERTLPKLEAPADRVRGYLILADAFVRLGHVTDAFAAYERALLLDPENPAVRKPFAKLLVRTGNAVNALALLEGSLYDEDGDAWMLRAKAQATLGDFVSAEQSYRRALAIKPSFTDGSISLAEVLLAQERADDARAVLTSAALMGGAEAWLALGRLEEQQGRAPEAESAYRSAVKAADSIETNSRLAQFLARAAKVDEAKAVLRHMDDMNSNAVARSDFEMAVGKGAAALGGYVQTLNRLWDGRESSEVSAAIVSRSVEAALQPSAGTTPKQRAHNARVVLKQNSNGVDKGTVRLLEAEIALVEGDLDEAGAASEQALEALPNSPTARYLRGLVLHARGQAADAEAHWQQAAEQGHLPSRLVLAVEASRQMDLTQAEEQSAAVLREEPANLSALLIYARTLERQDRLDLAEGILNRAFALDPDSVEAHTIAGAIALKRKAAGAALVAFRKALALDPRSRSAIDGLYTTFAQDKPDRRAIAKLEKMASAPPESATLLEICGRLYQLAGLEHDAKRVLLRALRADAARPTTVLALWQLGVTERNVSAAHSSVVQWLVQANSARKAGRSEEAVRGYEQALRAGDRSGVAANNLALEYAQRGYKLEEAFALAHHAVQLMPRQPEPLDTLGVVLLKRREYTAASEAFQRALALKPGAAQRRSILLHLADAYEASGLADEARRTRRSAGRTGA